MLNEVKRESCVQAFHRNWDGDWIFVTGLGKTDASSLTRHYGVYHYNEDKGNILKDTQKITTHG